MRQKSIPLPVEFLFREVPFERLLIIEEHAIRRGGVLVFARIVSARKNFANARALGINRAAIVLEMTAGRRHFDHPVFLMVDADLNVFVHKKPAQVVAIGLRFRRIEMHGDVTAAEAVAGSAVRARIGFCFH